MLPSAKAGRGIVFMALVRFRGYSDGSNAFSENALGVPPGLGREQMLRPPLPSKVSKYQLL